MNHSQISGKQLALLISGENNPGHTEASIFTGIARWDGTHLYLEREDENKSFQLPDDIMEQIYPVPPELRDFFIGSEYYLQITNAQMQEHIVPSNNFTSGPQWRD